MRNDANIEDALKVFQQTWDGLRDKNSFKMKEEKRIAEGKSRALHPVRALIKSLIDANVIVKSRYCWDSYSPGRKHTAPKHRADIDDKPLVVFETNSSPTWAPGVSLILEHPAHIEIAIPNQRDEHQFGAIVMRATTPHPDVHLIHRRFTSVEDGCIALAEFIAKNTVSVYGESVRGIEDEDYFIPGIGDQNFN